MNEVELLTYQTENAYNWSLKLIRSIPIEKWDIIPPTVESSITWQIGHLIMSHYFHSIMVIVGHQMDVLEKIPMKNYNELFTNAHPENSVGKTNPNDLLSQLILVQEKSLHIIRSLSVEELESFLEPTPVPHPIAKTKLEAIDWNIKHTMYHCGQVGMLKRIIDQRFDFGLQKPK